MVELVDTQDLKSCDLKSRAGSIPALSTIKQQYQRESSSVGRARPCQGRGREFESRLSLKSLPKEGIYC